MIEGTAFLGLLWLVGAYLVFGWPAAALGLLLVASWVEPMIYVALAAFGGARWFAIWNRLSKRCGADRRASRSWCWRRTRPSRRISGCTASAASCRFGRNCGWRSSAARCSSPGGAPPRRLSQFGRRAKPYPLVHGGAAAWRRRRGARLFVPARSPRLPLAGAAHSAHLCRPSCPVRARASRCNRRCGLRCRPVARLGGVYAGASALVAAGGAAGHINRTRFTWDV